jgi:molecular chaperone GrpE
MILNSKVKKGMDDNVTSIQEISEQEEQGEPKNQELSLAEQVAQAESKAAEYLDGWQRERAEFANARKRLERERSEAYLNANLEAARKLLPVLDDFDRALNSVPDPVAADSWFEGIEMVRRKLQATLESMNVTRIEAVGQPFDPNFHEALSLQPSETYESGLVIEELQTGYKLGDRVIRPSLVYVAA